MRISDLSRLTAVPVATIKFYLRERLLPPGKLTARNQATYGAAHVQRLRLVRALTDISGMEIAAVRVILEAVDQELGPCDLRRVVHRAQSLGRPATPMTDELVDARAAVDEYLTSLGWKVAVDEPARDTVALVLVGLRQLGWDCDVRVLVPYVEAAELLAVHEQRVRPEELCSDAAAANVIVGSILLETALVALHRMADQHYRSTRGSNCPQ